MSSASSDLPIPRNLSELDFARLEELVMAEAAKGRDVEVVICGGGGSSDPRRIRRAGTIGHVSVNGKSRVVAAILAGVLESELASKDVQESLEMPIRNHHRDVEPQAYLAPNFHDTPTPWSKRKKGGYRRWT